MYDFYEPDYHEPTTGELVYDEIKSMLLKAVKQEYLDEMERLRKENEELRPFRDAKRRYENRLKELKAEYDRKIEAAELNAKRTLMHDLFDENKLTAWKAGYRYIEEPKCDKCDSNRKVHFKSPSGKDLTEDCACSRKILFYEPKESYLVRFNIKMNAKAGNQDSSYPPDRPLYRYYAPRDTSSNEVEFRWDFDEEYGSVRYADDLNTSFDTLNRYEAVFLNYDRCKAYCDYLNDKREKEMNK